MHLQERVAKRSVQKPAWIDEDLSQNATKIDPETTKKRENAVVGHSRAPQSVVGASGTAPKSALEGAGDAPGSILGRPGRAKSVPVASKSDPRTSPGRPRDAPRAPRRAVGAPIMRQASSSTPSDRFFVGFASSRGNSDVRFASVLMVFCGHRTN